MKNFTDKKNIQIIFIWIIVIVGIFFNIFSIFHHEVWGDEGYSIWLIKGNLMEICKITAMDVHPPLYYLILKMICSIFGFNIYTYVMVSLLPMVLGILLAAKYFTKYFGVYVSVIYILLQSFSATALIYNAEIRMYSWAMLFVTICAFSAFKILSGGKIIDWSVFTAFGLMAAYTHYYALVTVAFIYIPLFVMLILQDSHNLKKCFICGGITVIIYFPWLLILLQTFSRVRNNLWISEIPSIKDCLAFLFGTQISGKIVLLIFASAVLTLFFLTIKKRRVRWDQEIKLLIICAIGVAGTFAVGVGLSYFVRPVMLTRYLYPSAGLVWLMVGISVNKAFNNKLINLILLVLLTVDGGMNYYNYTQSSVATYNITQYTVDFMEDHMNEDDLLVTDIDHLLWTVLDYYFPENQKMPIDVDYCLNYEGTVWLLLANNINEETLMKINNSTKELQIITDSAGLSRYPFHLYKLLPQN